jgi:hypothetical protein
MNNTFTIKRFGLLFKKTIAERPVQTIGVTVLLLLLSFILYVVAKRLSGFGAAQNLTFIWGLAGGGFFLASFVFGYFSNNASGSSYLTLPASYIEKWLCGILITGVLYPLIFLPFYHIMDTAFVAAYHNSLDPTSIFYKQQYESVYTFDLNGIVAWKVYSLFLMLTGSMLTGGLYFNKIPFIKTGIAFCIVLFAIVGINWLIASLLFDNVTDPGPYDHVTLAVGKEQGTLILPSDIENFFHYSLAFIIPAILWILPLSRLREKEF